MPDVNPGETLEDFLERCIPFVLEDGTAEDNDQAVAVCNQMFEDATKAKPPKRRQPSNMEHKSFTGEIKIVDPEGRTIEGHAAVFGNVDQGQDIIHPGAFTKTLSERGQAIRLLWQHDPFEPIGKPVLLQEDGKGLFFRAVISDTTRGRDFLALARDGAVDSFSIGYETVKGGLDFTKGADGENIRNLRELKLWEISVATFPMNEMATLTAIKNAQREAAPPEPPEPDATEAPALSPENKAQIVSAVTSLAEVLEAAGIEIPGFSEPAKDDKNKTDPAPAPPDGTQAADGKTDQARPDPTPPTSDVLQELEQEQRLIEQLLED